MLLLVVLCCVVQSVEQPSECRVVRSHEECPHCHVRGTGVELAFESEIVLASKLQSLGKTAVFEVQDGTLSQGTSFLSKKEVCISSKVALQDLQTELNGQDVKSQLWLLSGHDESPVILHQPELITETAWRHIVAAKQFLRQRDCNEKICNDLVEALLDHKSKVHLTICSRLRDLCLDSPKAILLRANAMPHQLLQRHVAQHQLAGPLDGVEGETSGVSEYLLCALLAACGHADDDILILDRLFDERRIDSLVTPAAGVAIFLQSRGERGLDLLQDRLVKYAANPMLSTPDANRRRAWVDGVIDGIDSVRKSEGIPTQRLRACVQKLLVRKEFLPRTVRALVALEDWSQGDVIADHFKTGVKESVGILLIDYLHRVTENTADATSAQVSRAEKALESIRQTHPQIFAAAKQHFSWPD